jgi:hypothetical protein
MAEKSRSNIKTKFENGDIPNSSDYDDIIDSAFNLSDDDSDSITEGSNKFVSADQKNNITNHLSSNGAVNLKNQNTGTSYSQSFKVWVGSQAEYDALGTYEDDVLYFTQ